MIVLYLVTALALQSPDGAPATCALYFDFTYQQVSNAYYGAVSADGKLNRIVDLGPRFDPQGEVTISTDGARFAFTCDDNATAHENFGCCSRQSVLDFDVKTGAYSVTSLHRRLALSHRPPNVTCGVWGCGFLEIGAYDAKARTVIGWLEALLPPPPPATAPAALPPAADPRGRRRAAPGNVLGEALVSFDLTSGNATVLNPLQFNLNRPKAPADMGQTAFDAEGQRMWFSCNPMGDEFEPEGLCSVSTAPSASNPKVTATTWSDENSTIASLQYSAPLKSAVALVNALSDDPSAAPVKTSVVLATSATSDWPVLLDLGLAWGDLHQTTISSDGRYLLVNLKTGESRDYPNQNLITVDLVEKKEVSRVKVKDNVAIAILAPVAC